MKKRTCKHCEQSKPLLEYSRDSKGKDNYAVTCKECKNNRRKNATKTPSKVPVTPEEAPHTPEIEKELTTEVFDYLFEKLGGSYSVSHSKNKFIIHKHGRIATLWKGKTPKQRVIDWVRSKNPSTMELKIGCVFEVKDDEGKIMKWTVTSRETESGFLWAQYENTTHTKLWTKHEMKWHKLLTILGSDMGLQELLIAIEKTNQRNFFECRSDGWISEVDEYGDPTSYARFNLTKNLHEQSEEFYTSLLPLING